MKIREIQSASNPLIKQIRSLHERAGRKKSGLFLLEGEKVVDEANRKGLAIRDIVVCRSYLAQGTAVLPFDVKEICVVDDALFRSLATTTTPQGIVATADLPAVNLEDCFAGEKPFLVVADAVQDPGNLGTVVRAAVAFDATAILLTKGSVDAFSPKVVRSAMGALFALPIATDIDADVLYSRLKTAGIEVLALDARAENDIWRVDAEDRIAVVLGNESNGLSQAARTAADKMVRIPISERSESLNVAVAAGIALSWLSHKRRGDQP